jgi:peroxiredoxin
MKYKLLTLTIVSYLLLTGCVSNANRQEASLKHSVKDYVPAEYLVPVIEALKTAGDNKDELVKVLKAVKPEERNGAAFVIATMPFPDLAAIKSDVLLEHIRYAYLVKGKYPWMKQMPEEVFLHYVLPYRCAQEPIEAYRKYFYEQLDPIVSQLTNLADVVHQVNLWLGHPKADGKPRVRFVQTEARDQGPIETLKSGYGRCEEMMIIYMSAARSVGVPCRSAWTPCWAICDNNHAWVEVWVDGFWRPIGGCEPGTPWFEQSAKRAAVVYSAAIGEPKSEKVYKSFPVDSTFKTLSIINSTPNYSRTCELKITVLSPQGEKMTRTGVALSVFNYGAFQPFTSRMTDNDGLTSFITGIGEYLLSAGKDNLRAWQVIKTEPDKKLDIVLKLSENNAPDGFLFLKYPSLDQAAASFNTPELISLIKHQTPLTPTYTSPAEIYSADEFDLAKSPEIADIIGANETGKVITQKLKSSFGNWRAIADAIREIEPASPAGGPDKRADLFWLITQMAHLERLETTKEFLLENINYAYLARSRAPYSSAVRVPLKRDELQPTIVGSNSLPLKLPHYKIADNLFRPYVLSPQFQYLHISPWRAKLYEIFSPMVKGSITDTARSVNEWVSQNISVTDKDGRFSYMAAPLDVYKSKSAGSYEVAMMTAAILRTLSIPAQVKSNWVEFHNGTEWIPLYPTDPKNMGNTKRNDVSRKQYIKPAGLKFHITRKGLPDTNIMEKIAVCQFQDGFWAQMENIRKKGAWFVVPPGQYFITAGIRDSNGDPYVFCKQIDLALDIPINLLGETERAVRTLPQLPDVELADLEGNQYSLSKTLASSNIILTFFSLDNEPSLRMLPMIDSALDTAKKSNTAIWAIYVDPEGKDKFLKDGRLKGLRIPVLLDSDQKAVKQFIPDFDKVKANALPSTLLIARSGKVIMWDEGYNMGIASAIESACLLLAGEKPAQANLPAAGRGAVITTVPFDSSGPDYIGDGDRFYKEGKYQESVNSYLKALQEDEDPNICYNLACDYALLGQIDQSIDALKKAVRLGYSEWHWMNNDPDLEAVRKDPRYKEIRR